MHKIWQALRINGRLVLLVMFVELELFLIVGR